MVSVSDAHILKTLKISLARLRPIPYRTRLPFEGLPRNLIRVQPNELLTTYKLFHLKSYNAFRQYHHLKYFPVPRILAFCLWVESWRVTAFQFSGCFVVLLFPSMDYVCQEGGADIQI